MQNYRIAPAYDKAMRFNYASLKTGGLVAVVASLKMPKMRIY
jgi:hypothetical protein